MDAIRDIPTNELLLEVMEFASRGAQSRGRLAKHLRRLHPLARLDRRLDGSLEVLRSEGLVTTERSGAAEAGYRTTLDGLAVLERHGRYSTAATVLFTDIAGSTELIDEVGESAAHEVRQRHFALLRRAVEKYRGHEVKNLGDGLMVIFAKAVAAVDCAGMMQRDVATDSDAVGLRVGLHAGELLRDGSDYFGSTVIIARRLCDIAQPGQTIASMDTCETARVTLEPLGPLSLKGIATPVNAVSLVWAESLAGTAG